MNYVLMMTIGIILLLICAIGFVLLLIKRKKAKVNANPIPQDVLDAFNLAEKMKKENPHMQPHEILWKIYKQQSRLFPGEIMIMDEAAGDPPELFYKTEEKKIMQTPEKKFGKPKLDFKKMFKKEVK